MTTHCFIGSNQVSNLNYRCTHYLMFFESSIRGESPPLPPETFFGRDELVEKVVDLAGNLLPIALIGAGGIGKTSIALTVLHHDRIKQRFGDGRRFIRCDKFPISRAHFLRRLSSVIGADIENPNDLTPLQPFLSSKEMLIVLDNAECILDAQGTDGQEIYAVVEDLCRLNNICILITSRTPATLQDCRCLDVPTLSMDAAQDTFYRIYNNDDRSNIVNDILELFDFHPLSITLLATVACQNKWDTDRLTRERERLRTSILQTKNNLAAAIELSLASPPLQELGADIRALLGVVAFFPQGVNGDNLDWLFPTIPNRAEVFDEFCALSLTYRSDGFIMMLGPLRDYFCPKHPKSSPLLCTTKDHYFIRMSASTSPDDPNFIDTRWITLEDFNVEHLLDVFTTIDADSDDVWNACTKFMGHLVQHKNRLTILQSKIKALPDDHFSKPECLFLLSQLFGSIGNQAMRKLLLIHTLKLERERGNDSEVAQKLWCLSGINRDMGLHDEGIQQLKEASKIYENLGDTVAQAGCLVDLAWLLDLGDEYKAAEEAASHAIRLIPEEDNESLACRAHYILGKVHQAKDETEAAIYQYEAVLGIASTFSWHDHDLLFEVHFSLAELFYDEDGFDEAKAHLERAEPYTVNNTRNLGRMVGRQAIYSYELYIQGGWISGVLGKDDILEMVRLGLRFIEEMVRLGSHFMEELPPDLLESISSSVTGQQARVWYEQRRVEEIRFDAARAVDIYRGLGVREVEEGLEDLEDSDTEDLEDPEVTRDLIPGDPSDPRNLWNLKEREFDRHLDNSYEYWKLTKLIEHLDRIIASG